jgi:hypothetical protein
MDHGSFLEFGNKWRKFENVSVNQRNEMLDRDREHDT